ncbi:MAG: alpha/beta fold hydrolase [Gemmatimonadota bacterium]|nr:MAG: alpha/beta fold hydrolase [Gemmatimonadota bacterium]
MLYRSACVTAVFTLVLTIAACSQDRPPPVDWLERCELERIDATAWCGQYSVFEDRDAMSGRKINLKVVVIAAASTDPEPDPVFYFVGGPGAAATESAGGAMFVLRDVRDTRDIVLVDQRGTGSSNPLDCDGVVTDTTLQRFFRQFLEQDFVEACLDKLRPIANVALYTTPVAMDDVDEIREALGYERINVYGGSYGTRAALVYLRRHTDHVRTAVLKGVAPTNMKNPLPFARAAERGLQGVFHACAVDRECHAAFPDLEGNWRKVLQQFEPGSVVAQVTHPETGTTETVTIPRGVFMDGIRHLLYTMGQSRHVPRIIHAASQGDFSLFAQHEIDQSIGFDNMLSDGMFMTVTCSEDLRFIDEQEIPAATQGTYLGDYRVRRQLSACRYWDAGEVTESYTEPVRVDTPVLLLSGVYDTATPYEGGDWVARYMPNSLHTVAPNQSHSFANPPCELALIARFIRSGTAAELDASCVLETKRPPFVIGDAVP